MKKLFSIFAVLIVFGFLFADDGTEEVLSFTEEPMEEEVVEDEFFLELLKTAVLPVLTPLDQPENTEEESHPEHIAISFISDEELAGICSVFCWSFSI